MKERVVRKAAEVVVGETGLRRRIEHWVSRMEQVRRANDLNIAHVTTRSETM
jgi:hypothetical protein